ncbi:MAG: hypothetical protein V2A34_10050 [Lentisphaerota bacterium]
MNWRDAMPGRCGCTIAVLLFLVLVPALSEGLRLEPSKELLSAEVVAVGLQGPLGMAVDPKSSSIYVAESVGNRIVRLADKASVPVITGGFKINDAIPAWAFSSERTLEFWTAPDFRKPAGLAFDVKGNLYVAEGGAGGRLLCFESFRDGAALARVLPTPWIETTYGYDSVHVDPGGRLFATSQDADRGAILAFGSVMMRETDGNWWLVDYGPFSEFSNIAVSPGGETMVVGEYRTADINWYDVTRQVEIGTMKSVEGLRHVVLLPDGTTLVSLSREDGTWSIIEVDPLAHTMWEWAGGLSEIGGLMAHPDNGDVYVSLVKEGKIMRFHRLKPVPARNNMNKLADLTQTFELEKALPPKDWPAFFRDFIERLGVVKAVDQHTADDPASKSTLSKVALTVGEFSSVVPVVAAKMKAHLLSPSELEPDPIVEVSILLFYPNKSTLTQGTIAPSISLFRALHKSGRVERTRFMPNRAGEQLDENMNWDRMPEVLVSFPSGYYAAETGLSEEGLVRTYFLGMGLGPDYWIDINRLHFDKSRMRVEKEFGQKLEYALEPFTPGMKGGGESVLVAGVKSVEMGWYGVGAVPILWNFINGDPKPIKFKHGIRLADMDGLQLPTEAATAASYQKKLTKEEIGMYRKLVLRATTRWNSTSF